MSVTVREQAREIAETEANASALRILILAQFYPPIIGGEEQHAHDLSRALLERGHEVNVLTLAHEDYPPFEVIDGVRVHRVRATTQRGGSLYQTARRHSPPFPDPEVVLALRRLVAEARPQIVHAHNWILHSFIPLKRWSGAKFLVTLHDYSLECAVKTLIYQERVCSGPQFGKCLGCANAHYGLKGAPTVLANWGMHVFEKPAVDLFLPVSQAVAEGNNLAKHHLAYEVVPNFVDDNLSDLEYEHDSILDQLPSEPFLLFVGDLRYFKGINVLLEAYGRLRNAPPLVLIGRDLPDTPTTLPANVYKMGSWPHDAVMQAFRRSLFTLAPSIGAEPFGIVVIEAMAAGRPVIGSRIGGIPDVIEDQRSGLLVSPGDADALQKAMETLLADPARIERMGQAARERSKLFHTSAVVGRIEQIYRRLLTEAEPARR